MTGTTRGATRDAEFTAYVAERSATLTRTAFLLCGDRQRAEDLVQIALTKAYLSWSRVSRAGARDAYVRKILVRSAIDESRRPWRRHELLADAPVDTAAPTSHEGDRYDDSVLTLLSRLPPGQRAAVVLRHWHDLSVEDTAAAVGCSPSTVKTQCARGLARLRDALTEDPSARPARSGLERNPS